MHSEPAGIAQMQQLLDVPHPALRRVALDWGPDIVYIRLNPRWMAGFDGERTG
jgi:hypothetical protein